MNCNLNNMMKFLLSAPRRLLMNQWCLPLIPLPKSPLSPQSCSWQVLVPMHQWLTPCMTTLKSSTWTRRTIRTKMTRASWTERAATARKKQQRLRRARCRARTKGSLRPPASRRSPYSHPADSTATGRCCDPETSSTAARPTGRSATAPSSIGRVPTCETFLTNTHVKLVNICFLRKKTRTKSLPA